MVAFTYNRDIPNPPNAPAVDVPNMQVNTNSIDDLIKVDHVSFNLANGGYHDVIHQNLQVANPAAIAGINQIYSKVPTIPANGDTQLFTRTGAGGISQLTGNVAADTGYTWCAGVLIQWGKVTSTARTTAVSFTPNFPTNVFNVQLTLRLSVGGSTTSVNCVSVVDGSLSIAGMNVNFTGTSANYTGFYWLAIGN